MLRSNALFLWRQLSTKQPSNVTTITLLKHTSDLQKTPSKLDTETTLHHFVTQNTGTLRNSVNMSGPWKTTTLTILFHGVSFHLAYPITVQVTDVTFASKKEYIFICRPDLSSLNKRKELVSIIRGTYLVYSWTSNTNQ